MEKLSRRSDGAYETPSGLFAVAPRAVSGKKDGITWFEFKASVLSEVTRVEWPSGVPVIVIEQATAISMLRNGYAHGITDDLMDQYNEAVAKWEAEQKPVDDAAAKAEADKAAKIEQAEQAKLAAEQAEKDKLAAQQEEDAKKGDAEKPDAAAAPVPPVPPAPPVAPTPAAPTKVVPKK